MYLKKILPVLCLILSTIFCTAQTKEQEGLVKTRGRLDNDGKVIPGVVISDASIILKGGNSTVSDKKGEFSILLPSENFYLQNVQKEGYVVVDQDVLSKQYAYSKNPLVLVMETPRQQLDDELAAERKIRRTLTRQLEEREKEIDRLKEENKISVEEYSESLRRLYDDNDNNEQLISEMAERYSKIDYDYLDEFYIQVSNHIMNGELTQADSMLNSRGDIDSDIEGLNQLKDANAKERADLTKRQKKLEKSEAMVQLQLEDIAQRCYSKYEIFKMQHQNDSALYYLEKRASLDTMNVQWMNEAGKFACEYMADYDNARLYYERALRNARTQYGDKSKPVIECYLHIGDLYVIFGEYEKSLEYYMTSLDMAKNSYQDEKLFIADIINDIGVIYHDISKYEQSLEYYEEALDICDSATGDNSMYVADVYTNMAALYLAIMQYDKAEDYYLKVLDIYKEKYGDNSLEASGPYLGLGSLYLDKGMYSMSIEYLNKVVEIRRTYFNEEHPMLSLAYNILGTIYYETGDYDLAYEYLYKALENRKALFGESHPSVLSSYNNISVLCANIDKIEEGKDMAIKVLEERMRLFGENHTSVAEGYNNVATFYYLMGDYDNVMDYYKKSLTIKQNLYGENHSDIAITMNNMSIVLRKQKKYDEALEYVLKSMSIYQNLLGENHIDIALSLNVIGSIYQEQKKYDDALDNYNKSLEMSSLLLEKERTVTIMDNMSECYFRIAKIKIILKEYDEALGSVMKAISLDKELYGEDSEYVSTDAGLIGDILYNKGKYSESLEYYQKSMEILLLYYPEDHEKVTEVSHKINEVNSSINK